MEGISQCKLGNAAIYCNTDIITTYNSDVDQNNDIAYYNYDQYGYNHCHYVLILEYIGSRNFAVEVLRSSQAIV